MSRPSPSEPIAWLALPGRDVCITGLGARSALGSDAPSSAAAVRCGISGIELHPFFIDKSGAPMQLAHDKTLDPATPLTSRFTQLLLSALEEALGDGGPKLQGGALSCWVGLPEPRPGLPDGIAGDVAHAVAQALHIDANNIHVIQRGHAAGLIAMQLAAQQVSSGKADFALVAGVDSYHDADTLEWLDAQGRLMSAQNRNGFPPGEGAGACLLIGRAAAERLGLPVLGTVVSACSTLEPKSIRSEELCIGEGLTAAVKGAVKPFGLQSEAITATYCDINGERYRNEEFSYTLLRTQTAFVDAHDYLCPADSWGDVGAASGPMFAALALVAAGRGYATGRHPLLWAGADSGHRTAVVLDLHRP